jgi:serine phosphatase RsbU (regulator of sigma subunit)
VPDEPPRIAGIDCAGYTRAASVTGGDSYDLWRTADGRLGMFLGDATGHGLGPAMVVSQTRTLIRGMCETISDPQRLLSCANARLADDLEAGRFVTAFLGFVSPDGTLRWCSAGHGPILIRTDATGGFESFDSTAPPLGIMPEFLCDAAPTAPLGPGGMIVIASDGITEAFAPSKEQFGEQRLVQLCQENSASASDLIERVRAAVREWQGGDDPRDDQTMIVASMLRN